MCPNIRRMRASRLSAATLATTISLFKIEDCRFQIADCPAKSLGLLSTNLQSAICNLQSFYNAWYRFSSQELTAGEIIMLSADGCRQRRVRLWKALDPRPDSDFLHLSDPIHLMYLANFWVDPFSLGAGFGGTLLVRKDGHAKLLHDNRLPQSVADAHVEERRPIVWYDGQSPGKGPRQLALLESVNPARSGFHSHDRPGDKYAATVINTLAQMRRRKDADEIAVLRRCMKAGEAGHAWARANVKPGMTELDVFCGVSTACARAAGHAVIVYGDFAGSPGPE